MSDFEQIAYFDGETPLSGMLFRPMAAPRAAILVFPSAMNPTESVINKARSLAADGYLAMVADFYGKQPENLDQVIELAAKIRATPDEYRRRLRASFNILVQMEEVKDLAIGVIGFCMGGQAALELAREGAPIFAAVSFHGLLDTEIPALPGTITARILVCHGDADPMVPRDQVLKFWEELDTAGANWHFHSYGGVKHGFTDPAPSAHPATSYDASADQQSWAAMHSLFDEILG